jgi:hypothetical protein
MQIFLKLKHWQLFLLLTVPSVLVLGTALYAIVFFLLQAKSFLFLVVAFNVAVRLSWCNAVVAGLQDLQPPGVKNNRKLIKAFSTFATTTFLLGGTYVAARSLFLPVPAPTLGGMFVYLLALLFSFFCVIYCSWHAAKTLTTATHYKEFAHTQYYDVMSKPHPIADFLLIWFFYVGIWFLQPRVQKMVSGGKDDL